MSHTFSAYSAIVVRFYLFFNTLPTATTHIATTNGSGEPGLYFNASDNKLYCGSGAPTFGATGVLVTTGVWYQVDIGMDFSPATSDTIDARVNNMALGRRTVNWGASSQNWVFSSGNGDIVVDDFVVSNTISDYPMGAGFVGHFVPVADGTHNISGAADFRRGETTTDILNATTTAFQLVDDIPLDDTTPDTDDHIRIVAPAAATDYVELIFGPAPGIATPTAPPRAVEVITEHFAAGTGLSDEIVKLNDNGTVDTIYDGTQVAGITTGIYKSKHYAMAPTGGAWTVVSGSGNFNNIRLRYGYATDANPDKSLMCAMIEAEFSLPIGKAKNIGQAVNRSAIW